MAARYKRYNLDLYFLLSEFCVFFSVFEGTHCKQHRISVFGIRRKFNVKRIGGPKRNYTTATLLNPNVLYSGSRIFAFYRHRHKKTIKTILFHIGNRAAGSVYSVYTDAKVYADLRDMMIAFFSLHNKKNTKQRKINNMPANPALPASASPASTHLASPGTPLARSTPLNPDSFYIDPIRGVPFNDDADRLVPANQQSGTPLPITVQPISNCLFPYLQSEKARSYTFDLYEEHYLISHKLLAGQQHPQQHTPQQHTAAKYFILLSINKSILIMKKNHINLLVNHGFFFNRCQNVICCHHCGMIYMFTATHINHYNSCHYKKFQLPIEEQITVTIKKATNFIPVYPVYNVANWNDSFTSLRYGNQSLLNSALEQWFVSHTASFLQTEPRIITKPTTAAKYTTAGTTAGATECQTDGAPGDSALLIWRPQCYNQNMARQVFYYQTLRNYANLLSLKYNFYKQACNYVDIYIRKTAHLLNPLIKMQQFNNNQDIIDTFNFPSSDGVFIGRRNLNCPVCLMAACSHILSCGHSFCLPCLNKYLQSTATNCPYCRTKILGSPIKIIFY